jgi:hypothetical protein
MAKIPWSRIREAFGGEWVELVECSWRADSLQPRAAVVRHHSPSRNDLLKTICRFGHVEGSVVIFVKPTMGSTAAPRHSFSPLSSVEYVVSGAA